MRTRSRRDVKKRIRNNGHMRRDNTSRAEDNKNGRIKEKKIGKLSLKMNKIVEDSIRKGTETG
jgi:hypothetical protein